MSDADKIKLIIKFINENNLESAEDLTKQLLENKPNSEIELNLLATIFIKQKKFEKSIKILLSIININPKFTPGLLNLGVVYEHLNNFELAMKYLKDAIKINNKHPIAYNNFGYILNKQKKFSEAIINFNKAIDLDKNYAEAYCNLGISYFNLNKLEDAEKNFTQVTQYKKHHSKAFFFLGEIQKKKNFYNNAINFYLKSKEPKTITRILESLLIIGNKKDYFEQINKLSVSDPENRRIAAVTAFLADQYNLSNKYPFCPDPLNYIFKSNLLDQFKENNFIESLLNEIKKQLSSWELPNRTTVKGFTTKGNLSNLGLKNLSKLEDFFDKEINKYKNNFSKSECLFIKNWPKKYGYHSWSNTLNKQGFNIPHIHPSGWLSGVFYLKVPKDIIEYEAGIEFSLHGDDFKIQKNIPKFFLKPKIGDLILFPSSLYHKTIPFNSNEERICIAFDIHKIE